MDCDPPNNNQETQNTGQLPQSSLISEDDDNEFHSAKGGSNDGELGTSLDPTSTAVQANGPNDQKALQQHEDDKTEQTEAEGGQQLVEDGMERLNINQQQQVEDEKENEDNNEPPQEDADDYSSYDDQSDKDFEEEKQVDDETEGCQHYRKRCQSQCSECKEFFTCRFCHDAKWYDNEMDPKKNHQMDRHAVKEIRCLKCKLVQKPQQNCEKCGIEFGQYFCGVCNMFDNEWEKKKTFHCDGCGICRIGPKDKFYHCDKCCACLTINQKDNHICIPQKMKQDCPVCMMDMHTSRLPTQFLRCGHAMHTKCFFDYVKHNIACPICKKSVCDPKHFEAQMDVQIATMPMPDEYKNQKMLIICNDCQSMSEVPFHILGGKCDICCSYNTTRTDSEGDKLKFQKQKSNKQANDAKNNDNQGGNDVGGNGDGGNGVGGEDGDDNDWQDLD